jgi:hypothetical protein
MVVHCALCTQWYDDEYRVTFCPHDTFLANDGTNRFAHHPRAYLAKVPPPAPGVLATDDLDQAALDCLQQVTTHLYTVSIPLSQRHARAQNAIRAAFEAQRAAGARRLWAGSMLAARVRAVLPPLAVGDTVALYGRITEITSTLYAVRLPGHDSLAFQREELDAALRPRDGAGGA